MINQCSAFLSKGSVSVQLSDIQKETSDPQGLVTLNQELPIETQNSPKDNNFRDYFEFSS